MPSTAVALKTEVVVLKKVAPKTKVVTLKTEFVAH